MNLLDPNRTAARAARRHRAARKPAPRPAQKAAAPPPRSSDPRLVQDDRWPGMYRVRRPDGSLSDMANRARAQDALRCLAEEEARTTLQKARGALFRAAPTSDTPAKFS